MQSLDSNYKFSLLVCTKRVSQLVYLKLQEIEKLLLTLKNKESDNIDDSIYLDTQKSDEEEDILE